MMYFLLRRLAFMPVALFLANCCGYILPSMVNRPEGADAPPLDAVLLAAFRDYGVYLQGVMQGDIGTLPYAGGNEPITQILAESAVASLGLLAIALFLSIGLGMLLGLSAVRRDPPGVALWLTSFSTVGLAMPGFYVGTLCIAGTILYIIYGPGTVGQPPLPIQGFGWDAHLVFPTLVLMLQPMAKIAQVTASLLTAELGKQYVVAARSLGHAWGPIVRRYALRNVIAAIIATVAGSLRLLVGELIIVERLFDWPGLGRLVSLTLVPSRIIQQQSAVLFLNPALIAGLLTIFAALFLLADLLAALLARSYDPRLRTA